MDPCIYYQSDSQSAVNLINGEEDDDIHSDKILIEDCRSLIRDINTSVLHVLREVNKCADKLAKIGRKQGEQAVRTYAYPTGRYYRRPQGGYPRNRL